jgi:hypothetical protein
MTVQPETQVVLELNCIDELFNAPDINPFSPHEVEILGQSGLDRLQKRLLERWPSQPGPMRLTARVPPDQMTPDLAQQTLLAIQRYSVEKIEANRQMRRHAVRTSLRLLVMALPVVLFTAVLLFLFTIPPLAALPPVVAGIVSVLVLYASGVAILDSVYSLVFDWVPFVRDNSTFQRIRSLDLTIEPQGGVESPP